MIKYEEVRTITEHTKPVLSLLLLKDKRVASSSWDKTIRIYDPTNNYNCAQSFERHNNGVRSICLLDDGNIVSCSFEQSIVIGNYRIKYAHDKPIFKIITLPNNRVATCSMALTIKIWKSNPPYNDKPIKVLYGHNKCVHTLLYIKERDIMISGSSDNTIRMWNISLYQCISVIEGVKCCDTNALYKIDKDRVISGGIYTFFIVNINKCVIEKTVVDESFGRVFCFLKLREYIICGCSDGLFCFYDMDTENYLKIKNNHKNYISDLLLLDDNTFLSCSGDNTIKVCNY